MSRSFQPPGAQRASQADQASIAAVAAIMIAHQDLGHDSQPPGATPAGH